MIRAGALVATAAAFALAGCASAPGAPPSAAASGIELPAGFPLGSWVVTITEQDLRDAGLTDAGLIKENAGTFTRTYAADGTWTIAQVTSEPIRWPVFSGTFRAIGPDRIQETTNFPDQYRGEVIMFTWQREGSGIRLTVVDPPDPILPITTETHAWQPG